MNLLLHRTHWSKDKTIACVWKVFGSNVGQDTAILIKDFCGFPQSLKANVEIVPRLGHDRFLPHLLQFIHPTLYKYESDSVVK
jgi:hypothetical protein